MFSCLEKALNPLRMGGLLCERVEYHSFLHRNEKREGAEEGKAIGSQEGFIQCVPSKGKILQDGCPLSTHQSISSSLGGSTTSSSLIQTIPSLHCAVSVHIVETTIRLVRDREINLMIGTKLISVRTWITKTRKSVYDWTNQKIEICEIFLVGSSIHRRNSTWWYLPSFLLSSTSLCQCESDDEQWSDDSQFVRFHISASKSNEEYSRFSCQLSPFETDRISCLIRMQIPFTWFGPLGGNRTKQVRIQWDSIHFKCLPFQFLSLSYTVGSTCSESFFDRPQVNIYVLY